MTYYILDSERRPVPADMRQWGEWFGQMDNRRVGRTDVGDSEISTVFLGLPHVGGMFETMVFGGPFDQEQERCETWADAEAMHARWVKRCEEATE